MYFLLKDHLVSEIFLNQTKLTTEPKREAEEVRSILASFQLGLRESVMIFESDRSVLDTGCLSPRLPHLILVNLHQ